MHFNQEESSRKRIFIVCNEIMSQFAICNALLQRLDALSEKASVFLHENFPTRLAKLGSFHKNDLVAKAALLFKFCRGLAIHGGISALENYVFAWHGTAMHNVELICKHGFHPSRRARQSFGAGEYFGAEFATSMRYSTGTMILVLLLQCTNLKTHGNIFIMANPEDGKATFCLPLIVVEFVSLATTST